MQLTLIISEFPPLVLKGKNSSPIFQQKIVLLPENYLKTELGKRNGYLGDCSKMVDYGKLN
jgi:hypothetical protein